MADPWRVAQIAVEREPGTEGSRGSGYLIAPGRVLTAAHVVAGASVVRVRLDVGQDSEIAVQAGSWWADPAGHEGTDLAVITIPESATAGRAVEVARFGRISDCAAVLKVEAFGFPLFKLRDDAADTGRSGVFRDFEQATGHAPVAANRRQGTLAVYLADPPPSQPPTGEPSPWEGMSGGPVFTGGRIVAVVAEHHPGEGTGRLTARRIDRAYQALSAADLGGLAELLALPPAAGGLPDVVPQEPEQLVRSAYLAQVRDIAPDRLIGRDDELADWAGFCAGADPYTWWQAGPWAGKSALASWFVLHPPAGVEIVSFFITGRLSGQADSDAFLNAMIEQLTPLYPAGGSTPAVGGARAGVWWELLASAAAEAEGRGRRLIVVVDGLDEDEAGATPPRGRPSIASLLPRRSPPGVRFIVTSRPDPGLPDDLPSDHPLRICRPHRLPVSPVAKDIELSAKQELRDLLAGDQVAIDVVGYIAGSGGGLNRGDLSALTGAPPHKLDPVLRGVFGRSLYTRASTDPRDPQADPATRVYLFAHETLRVTAEEQLGGELARYRQKVHEWIDTYASSSWPGTTPSYAIRGYPRLLAATADVTRLSALARDPHRHAFLLEATGDDYTALTEIGTAQSLITDQKILDLKALVELAAYRVAIFTRNESIPDDVAIMWAQLGRFDHAEALARTIADANQQAVALALLADVIAQAGDLVRAESLARTIADANQTAALVRLVIVIGRAGDLVRAESVARTITDPSGQEWALTELAAVIGRAGDLVRAESLARTIADANQQAAALALLADVIAQAGDLVRAESLARTIADANQQTAALVRLVIAAARAGDRDRANRLVTEAEPLARTIADPHGQAEGLSGLAIAAAQAGDQDRASRLVADAEVLVRTTINDSRQAQALVNLAIAGAQAGEWDRAESLARTAVSFDIEVRVVLVNLAIIAAQAGEWDRAESLSRTTTEPYTQAEVLAGLAITAAQAGDQDRAYRLAADAESLSRTTTEPYIQAEVLAGLAIAAAQGGDQDRAESLASDITNPSIQAEVLAGLAIAAAQAGDQDRAYRLAADAEALARTTTDPDIQAYGLANLAIAAAEGGDLDRAESLARDITDPGSQEWALTKLATAATQAGHLDRADRLAADAESLRITHNIGQAFGVEDMVIEAAQAGNLDRAESLARDITDPRSQAEVLASLATAAAEAGDRDRADRLAADAESLARTITDPIGQAHGLANLAIAAAQAGDQDRTHRLGADAESLARKITYPPNQAQTLAMLAIAAAQVGDFHRAESLARDITEPGRQAWALTGLAIAAARAGDLDRAARPLAMVLVMDAPPILWMKTVAQFFPSAIGDAWDILAGVYARPT